jgi:hypothetical protein
MARTCLLVLIVGQDILTQLRQVLRLHIYSPWVWQSTLAVAVARTREHVGNELWQEHGGGFDSFG